MKKLTKIGDFLNILAVFFVSCSWCMAIDYTNVIPNGDFEDGSTNWTGTVISIFADGRFYKVAENSITQVNNIPLQPNTTYNLRCYFMEKDKKEVHNAAYVGIKFFNSANQQITSSSSEAEQIEGELTYSSYVNFWFHYMSYFDTPGNWDCLNINFTTGCSTAYCQLKIVNQDYSYTFYTEKIELFEYPVKEYVFNGSFEDTSSPWNNWKFGWSKYSGESGIITDTTSGYGSKYVRISGDSTGVGAICTYDDVLVQPDTDYTFTGRFRFNQPPPVNPALFGIRFYDKDGVLITGSYQEDKFIFSTYINMHYKYIPQSVISTTWSNWNLRFITPKNAYSAKLFIYKWCNNGSGNPTYMDVDQISLTSDPDRTVIGNFGFEAINNGSFSAWSGNYNVSTESWDGNYALELSNTNCAESDYISVDGGAYYLFKTMVMEPQSLSGTNTALFALEVFDQNKNSLMDTVSVENLNYSSYLSRWYSYLYGTAMDSAFEPDGQWKRYEKWFRLPSEAKYIKLRLQNWQNNVATRFDNAEIVELKYCSTQKTGFKCAVLWYGNYDNWPISNYISTTDKVEAFYPYIGHANNNSLDSFDEWMIDTILFMSNFPEQNPQGWNTYLDRLFAVSGDSKWLLNLNQAVVDIANELNDSTHKVKVIIALPLMSSSFSADDFASAVSYPATNRKVADWYYANVIQRWQNLQSQLPKLELAGFYCEEEYLQYKDWDFIQQIRKHCLEDGYVLTAAPYSRKAELEIDGVVKYRDVEGGSYYLPQFFDCHYLQPNYFYDNSNVASSLVDYTIIWSGINHCSIDLEWTGNNERFQAYLDKGKMYGMLEQDASFVLYETSGWLYYCAKSTGEQRSLYDNLNDFLHNR